ncbi:hypothetical protein CDEST_05567 [Colletotrichum destructivum]|uniref:DUF6594 domain-containing protein n=1 Tax=Colletotrichum destructivum TaxID=34406 RepID=A0AAX4IB07_9PEZI|nr:hypothetical protein CDEST_05567 [Colletotrichum destructivum]
MPYSTFHLCNKRVSMSMPRSSPSKRRTRAHLDRATKSKEGYANVARWMALDADGETHIYRKFDELAARNLLFFQSELLALAAQLDHFDEKDAETDDMDLKDAAMTWETLERRAASDDRGAKSRMELIMRIREKIIEYHEALLLHSEITKLRRPNRRVLDAFLMWFKQPFPALGGRAKTFLDDPDDLVALNAVSETDFMSEYLRRHWPAQKEISRDASFGIGRYDEGSVTLAVAIVSILVAAVLLVGSITSLYFVQSDAAKLGMIAAFTALFATSVGTMTTARRAEIFAATAAYAAVLVVFVSGNISSN